MKILFISQGGDTCDYLRDMVLHGFRELLGPDFVDVGRVNTMYKDFGDVTRLYGRGMTLYGLLGDDSAVDRSDIPRKIRDRYYDLVIYGSIHRCHDYLHEVASQYDPTRVIFIDGEDHPGYLKGLGGVYFKRELHSIPAPNVFPIQFAIPASKILRIPPRKSRLMAPMDPIDASTYIYTTESEYYAQYAQSYYAKTMKKAGWDCMRHYEIMANWCIPYFRCFDQCPPTIMEKLPRADFRLVQECFDAMRLLDTTLEYIYRDLICIIMRMVCDHLTTVALATRILDTVGVRKKEYSCT